MRIKIFENSEMVKQEEAVNAFLAQDGKTISVDKVHVSAGGDRYSVYHYVTVLYDTLEQAPDLTLEMAVAKASS